MLYNDSMGSPMQGGLVSRQTLRVGLVSRQTHLCYGDEEVSSMSVDWREGFQEDVAIRSLQRGGGRGNQLASTTGFITEISRADIQHGSGPGGQLNIR